MTKCVLLNLSLTAAICQHDTVKVPSLHSALIMICGCLPPLCVLDVANCLGLRDRICRSLLFRPLPTSYVVKSVQLQGSDTVQPVMYLRQRQPGQNNGDATSSCSCCPSAADSNGCSTLFNTSDLYEEGHPQLQAQAKRKRVRQANSASSAGYRLVAPYPQVVPATSQQRARNQLHQRQTMTEVSTLNDRTLANDSSFDKQLYVRDIASMTPEDYHTSFDVISLRSGSNGESIVACFIGNHPSTTVQSTTTILYCHANATDLGLMRSHMIDLSQQLKCNVCSFDYRGYGCSDGKASTSNSYEDVDVVYNYLQTHRRKQCQTLIVLGQSLGTGIATYLCQKHGSDNIAGLVLHSPLLSGLKALLPAEYSLDHPRAYDPYPVFQQIPNLSPSLPIYFIHGQQDRELPVYHTLRLYELTQQKQPAAVDHSGATATNTPTARGQQASATTSAVCRVWLVTDGNHHNIETQHRDEYLRSIDEFIGHCKSRQSEVASSKSSDTIAVS